MKIAVCQGEGVKGQVPRALKIMRDTAVEAASCGAMLVVFPEMFLTGYRVGDQAFKLAEHADGPAAAAAGKIARETGVSLLYGYPERSGGRIFNSARLIEPARGGVANYRKTHLYGSEENRLFQRGDSLVMAELDGLKVGILICYDVEFPEAVRALALAEADLIAVPTALFQPYDIVARTLVPARAFENQVYVAYADMCGNEGGLGYCGLSCIVGPDGKDIARAGTGQSLLIAEIDLSAIPKGRKSNPYLSGRRPELYAAPVKQARSPSTRPEPMWGENHG